MKIRYDGPRGFLPVGGYGPHPQGEVKDYPDAFGRELIETNPWHKLVKVGEKASGKPAPAPEPAAAPQAGPKPKADPKGADGDEGGAPASDGAPKGKKGGS